MDIFHFGRVISPAVPTCGLTGQGCDRFSRSLKEPLLFSREPLRTMDIHYESRLKGQFFEDLWCLRQTEVVQADESREATNNYTQIEKKYTEIQAI